VSRFVSRIYLRLTINLLYKGITASVQFPPSPPHTLISTYHKYLNIPIT